MEDNEKGMATLETIPLLVIFVIFVGYGLGSFGVIHTAILNSIASRTYAFETFRHRAQLRYFRDESSQGDKGQYYEGGTRLHGIQTDAPGQNDDFIFATERGIARGMASNESEIERSRQEGLHREIDGEFAAGAFTGRPRQGTNVVWIKVYYGICLDAGCGDTN